MVGSCKWLDVFKVSVRLFANVMCTFLLFVEMFAVNRVRNWFIIGARENFAELSAVSFEDAYPGLFTSTFSFSDPIVAVNHRNRR